MINIHKMEIFVVDHEGYGIDEFKTWIKQSSYASVCIFNDETVTMPHDQWEDDNVLNSTLSTYEEVNAEFEKRRSVFYPYLKTGEKVLAMHNKMEMKFDATPLTRDGVNYYGVFDVFGQITYIKERVFKNDFTIIGE